MVPGSQVVQSRQLRIVLTIDRPEFNRLIQTQAHHSSHDLGLLSLHVNTQQVNVLQDIVPLRIGQGRRSLRLSALRLS